MCPPGEHSSSDRTKCTCPGVRVLARGRDLQCVVCAPGTFELSDGTGTWNGTCSVCPSGYMSQTSSASFCTPCTTGTFSNTDRMFLSGDACIPCSLGTYKGWEGDQACLACDVGLTTVSNGTVSNNTDVCVCKAGYFINDTLGCEACPENTYNPFNIATGSESCLPCTFRFFQPAKGRAEC
ncbi:hypothetical protein T484DRAFT_1647559, partial [Baffinella frigidus]